MAPKKVKNRRKYTCHFCEQNFKVPAVLANHLKICKSLPSTKLAVYSCKKCHKRFRFKKSFLAHNSNEHSTLPGSIACSLCQVRCPNQKVLKEHIHNIHERAIFPCPKCGKEFVRQSHVIRHMAQKGCDGQPHPLYPCEICQATFSRKDNLMVHLRTQHITKKAFECKLCDFGTSSFSKLILHFQNNHHEGPHFECDHCGKTTSSRASMAKHLEIHGEKKYACDVCGYSTFTLEVMRRHVLTHVKEKPYKCSLCPRSFIQRSQLQNHLDKHQHRSCDVCGKIFTTKYRLIVHKKEHKSENGNELVMCPNQDCPYAEKGFKNLGQLKQHMETHAEKSFKCEVCDKRYASEMLVRRHVVTHTLERARRCMYCVAPRAYVRGLQLVRHVRRSHPTVFADHLLHVRSIIGLHSRTERVKQSEMQLILNVLDAEADRIIQGYGEGVLYGGMQDASNEEESHTQIDDKMEASESKPLMSEEALAGSLNELLSRLIDKDTLECFGWPDQPVDIVLEKVIIQCGGRAAERERWTRVQRLRENAKQLFLCAVDDKNIAHMLDTHTIDQVVKYVLDNVSEDD